MQKRKLPIENFTDRDGSEKKFLCQVCGRELEADACFWHEDDDGMICRDCTAERNSCGCSD